MENAETRRGNKLGLFKERREGPRGWEEKSKMPDAGSEESRAASHRAVGHGKELSLNLQAVEGTGWF